MARGLQRWFDITCRHGYFADQVCHPLRLTPTPACQRLLRRYRLWFEREPGGGAVYFDPDDPLQLLRRFDEAEPFTFTMHSSDPALLSYTDGVPAAGAIAAPGVFYFDNLAGEWSDLLHPSGMPFGGGRLAVRQRGFRYNGAPPGTQMRLRARGGGIVCEGGRLDLSGLADGRYGVEWGGRTREEFYLSDEIEPIRQFGVAAVYAAPGHGDGLYPLDGACNSVQRSYRVVFESLRCRWCYVVLASSANAGPPEATVTVVDRRRNSGSAEISFGVADDATPVMIDGLPATTLVSNELLPLQEVPDADLSFILHRGGQAEGLKLPYACHGSLARAAVAPYEVWANMYI